MQTNQQNRVAVFGVGFVGGKYIEAHPTELVAIDRDEVISMFPNILYLRSTIHNYHPKDGNPYIDVETNLLHFLKVLDENRKLHGVNLTFNLVSTWFVYGKTNYPAKEDTYCNPTGFYSITARAREQLLMSYAETFGIKYRILRLGGVIGIGDTKISPKKNALQWMIKEVAQGREVKVYDGDAIRDYIDVRDCARAIHLVLEKGNLNEIYNIANGQGLRISELVDHANATVGWVGKVGTMPVPEFHKTVQVPSMYLNVQKIKNLGYVQQHDIKTTVAELAKFYQNES